MGFRESLFPTNEERERQLRKKRNKELRKAERAVERVKERIEQLKQERDQAWLEAKKYQKDGHPTAVDRSLQSYRVGVTQIENLETKRWACEQYLTDMGNAISDQELTQAIANINKVIMIDPDRVGDIFDDVAEQAMAQNEVNREWQAMYGKQMSRSKTGVTIPSLDDLKTQLVDEVADELRDETATNLKGEAIDDKQSAIREGRERLRDLMEGGK